MLLKIGHRKSARHYRIYTGHQNNSLRFEAEMKGDLIKDLHDLLIASTFDQQDFETRLSYQFFKYSFQLFSLTIHTSHLDWLMNRIRPLQFKNTFISDISIIHSHYLNQMNLNQVKEKKHLITLLQLLVYVRGLKYNTQRLRAKYRQFRFPLHDFLKYTGKTRNQYQLNKFKDFFDLVRQNFGLHFFYTDWIRDFYRKLRYTREFNTGLVTDYLRQSKFDSLNETKSFFRFLQFLSFLRKMEGFRQFIDDQVYIYGRISCS